MVAATVRYLSWFVIACGLVGLGNIGCVVVRAHERGHLARRAMTGDRDAGEARFAEHERGAREGAEGGTGQPGGGCGCN